MTDHVTLYEVGPRDGLQNEVRQIATDDKIRLVNLLSASGLTRIEVTSFVSPKWVPQSADAAAVLAGITREGGVTYAALTPNLQGLKAAMAAEVDEVAVFASASEGFSRANNNCSIAECLDRFAPVLAASTVPVRGYVSCVTDCPYDGPTPPQQVVRVVHALIDMGCHAVSLGDTIGHATPQTTARMLDAVLDTTPAHLLAGHFHDTNGHALSNIAVALDRGLRVFDTSVAGLGGCPFAPGAKGNAATETVLDWLTKQGLVTGVDPTRLAEATTFARTLRST